MKSTGNTQNATLFILAHFILHNELKNVAYLALAPY